MEYDFTIDHVPGYMNLLPDHLSRLYSKTDSWGVSNLVASKGLGNPGHGNGERTDGLDPHPSLLALSPDTTAPILAKEQLMLTLGKLIPEPAQRPQILAEVHSKGHAGVRAVVEEVYNRGFWWQGLRQDVERLVGSCSACQKHSVIRHGYHPLRSPAVLEVGDLLDLFSSYVWMRPLKTKGAEETAHQLLLWIADWGPPRILNGNAVAVDNFDWEAWLKDNDVESWIPRCEGAHR